MSNIAGGSVKRHVVATMYRGKSKEVIDVRRYAYFDTAMPRMVQLAINYCNEGDFIEFATEHYGFQLGILRIGKGGRFDMEMNPLIKSCPALLKLMTQDPLWESSLLSKAMKR